MLIPIFNTALFSLVLLCGSMYIAPPSLLCRKVAFSFFKTCCHCTIHHIESGSTAAHSLDSEGSRRKVKSRLFLFCPIAVMLFLMISFIIYTELAIRRSSSYVKPGDSNWTFGQTLAMLLVFLPLRDLLQVILKPHRHRYIALANRIANADQVQHTLLIFTFWLSLVRIWLMLPLSILGFDFGDWQLHEPAPLTQIPESFTERQAIPPMNGDRPLSILSRSPSRVPSRQVRITAPAPIIISPNIVPPAAPSPSRSESPRSISILESLHNFGSSFSIVYS